jgi:hypothetical protein
MEYIGNSFVELTKMFLREKNLKSKDILMTGEGPTLRFLESTVAIEWAEYHKEHAEIVYEVAAEEEQEIACEVVVEEDERKIEETAEEPHHKRKVRKMTGRKANKAEKLLNEEVEKVLERGDRKKLKDLFTRQGQEWKRMDGVCCEVISVEADRELLNKLLGKVRGKEQNRKYVMYNGNVYYEKGTNLRMMMCTNEIQWKPASHHQKIQHCFRQAIRSQLQAHKWQVFQGGAEVRCALSGKRLLLRDCHMDHYEPIFIVLTERFLEEKNLKESDLKTKGSWARMTFQDEEVEMDWMEYHKCHAQLRPTLAENRKRGTGGERRLDKDWISDEHANFALELLYERERLRAEGIHNTEDFVERYRCSLERNEEAKRQRFGKKIT